MRKLGCYGSALSYQPETPVCTSCAFSQACSTEVGRRLGGLRVSLFTAAAAPTSVLTQEEDYLLGPTGPLSTHAKKELRRLCDAGYGLEKLREKLRGKQHPNVGPLFLRQAFTHLCRSGKIERHELRQDFERHGATSATVRHQLATVNGLMGALKIVKKKGSDWHL